ncbi:MAG: hypothetical protein K5871_00775 [Lachnospiraceae bacterium]|nr:hypothetical protein [Lachnospiraceae bacterium]
MNYAEARNYIENTGSSGIVPGTEVIKELLSRLGDPQESLNVIHVAGTNGKGSICTYLESALNACSLKVGRYASPSVFRYLERIRLADADITEEDYAEAVDLVSKAAEGMTIKPTGFEAETAAAFLFFYRKKADVVIAECGMGGREDATNVFTKPLATVFAPISMDHMSFLGDDPEKIAVNKAGIMRRGVPAIISHMPEVEHAGKIYSPEDILIREAGKAGAECITSDDDLIPAGFENPLPGAYQSANLNTALHVLQRLCPDLKKRFPKAEITYDIMLNGLHNASWPGRFEMIKTSPAVIRDGAHNPGAVKALRGALALDGWLDGRHNVHLIMGVFKDKDYPEILRIMLPGTVSFSAIDLPDRKRGLPSQELAQAALSVREELFGAGLSVPDPHRITVADSLKAALDIPFGKEDLFVVFGSLSLMQLFDEADL